MEMSLLYKFHDPAALMLYSDFNDQAHSLRRSLYFSNIQRRVANRMLTSHSFLRRL